MKDNGYTVSKQDYIYRIATPDGCRYLLFPESLSVFRRMMMERDGADRPQERDISLSHDALESAQAAAEATGKATGEAPAVFIARAIETQAKRDKSSIALGINPATGDKLKREA